MTVVVLLILAVIWAAVLVPPALQNRRENRPGDSIAMFRNQLHVLERATPGFRERRPTPMASRPAMVRTGMPARAGSAPSRREVRRRRRDIFVTLLGGVVVTMGAAVLLGGVVWALQVVVDILFVGYVGMLIRIQQQAAEREMKVAYLPEHRSVARVEQSYRSAVN